MPTHDFMSDDDVAAVTNYVLQGLNQVGAPIEAAAVAKLRSGSADPQAAARQAQGVGVRCASSLSLAARPRTGLRALLAHRGTGGGPQQFHPALRRLPIPLDGSGSEAGGIPDFRNYVGAFAHTEDGRRYLMHVPGVVSASLSDKQIADVMNYVMETWAGSSLPADYRPFTGDEVTTLRAEPVDDVGGLSAEGGRRPDGAGDRDGRGSLGRSDAGRWARALPQPFTAPCSSAATNWRWKIRKMAMVGGEDQQRAGAEQRDIGAPLALEGAEGAGHGALQRILHQHHAAAGTGSRSTGTAGWRAT